MTYQTYANSRDSKKVQIVRFVLYIVLPLMKYCSMRIFFRDASPELDNILIRSILTS